MKHEDAVELLPWLANGSLDAAERAELTEHLAACATCRRELEGTIAAGRLYAGAHPTSAELVEAVWAESSPKALAAIERHAAACDECRRELELVRASRALEAAWPASALPTGAPGPRPRSGAAPWLLAASVVAALGAALFAFGVWRSAADLDAERIRLAADLQRSESSRRAAVSERGALAARLAGLEAQVAALLAPRAGIALVELLPVAARRGGSTAPAPVRLDAATADSATLLLVLENPLPGELYRVHFAAGGGALGTELFVLDGVRPDARGALVLHLATAALPSGRIDIEVRRGIPPSALQATYSLVVTR